MATQKRTRLCISLNGEPAAVEAAAAALEALLGTATVQFGPVVPSTRRPGQAHVAGSLWQPAPHDGGALREVAVGYAVDATAVADDAEPLPFEVEEPYDGDLGRAAVPLVALIDPARFYALRDRAKQAAALALLDGVGKLEFASACAGYLEAQYGYAVPVLAVVQVWYRVGLLAEVA